MVSRAVDILSSTVLFWTMSAWLAVFSTVNLWPPSFWFTITHMEIVDTPAGEPVLMVVDRTIKRPFVGHYSIVIRKLTPSGWTIYCTTGPSPDIDYDPDSALPNPLTLEWWTGGRCHNLPEGSYRMTTNWVVTDHGILPDKGIKHVSNVFHILPAKGAPLTE